MKMKNNMEEQDIKKNVLEKITKEEVKMTPRFHFVLKLVGLFALLILTLVVSSLLVSYILFTLKVSGHLFLLGLGMKGLQAFLLLFPWIYLIVDCILLVILDWLLKRFSFVYHSPVVYLTLATLAVILVFGFIINYTSFHGNLQKNAHNNQLPVFRNFYQNLTDEHREQGVFIGTVLDINANSFIVLSDDFYNDLDDGEETIILPVGSDASKEVYIGELVFVAGDRISDNLIQAYGVREMVDGE